MPNFRKVFEQGSFKNKSEVPYEKLNTPFKKDTYKKGALDEEKNREEEFAQEADQKYYNEIIEELRSKKKGGVDIHLSQINITELGKTEHGKEALELYKLHSQDKLEEEIIRGFLASVQSSSNEYNFGAMLLNWSIDKTERKKAEEKELLKEKARQKLTELKRKNPHIVAYIKNIDIDLLNRLDLKVISNIDQINIDQINLGDYKNNLKEYFVNKTKGKPDQEWIIENDPRFKCYCALRGILNLEPGSPEEFIK